jgi:hypothetical protein
MRIVDFHDLEISRQNLSQGPLNSLGGFVDDLNLAGMVSVRRQGDGLQGIANVMVHVGYDTELVYHDAMPPLFVPKHHPSNDQPGKHVIKVEVYARYLAAVQSNLKQGAEKEQADTYGDA